MRTLLLLVVMLVVGCAGREEARLGAGGAGGAGADFAFTPVNFPPALAQATFHLHVPGTVTEASPARGVLGMSDHGTGGMFGDARWRALAARQRLVMLRYRVAKPGNVANVAPDADGLQAVLTALEHFAVVARRPELADSPVVFCGLSASAAQACMFADLVPDRTIAVLAYHGSTHKLMPRLALGRGSQAPQLHVISSADSVVPPAEQVAYFQKMREFGAPATAVVQANVAHDEMGDPAFAMTWLESVVARRAPQKVRTARRLPLAEVHADEGYLGTFALDAAGKVGSVKTGRFETLRGQKDKAAWLPDAEVARAWEAYMLRTDHGDDAIGGR